MIKYRAYPPIEIKKIVVARETAKQVICMCDWFGTEYETREYKTSEYQNWFDTFEEAREFLLKREYARRNAAVKALKQHEKNIIEINEMKEDQ
jgi:hypothetical protein